MNENCVTQPQMLPARAAGLLRHVGTWLYPVADYGRTSFFRKLARPLVQEMIAALTGWHDPAVLPADGESGMLFYVGGVHMLDLPAAERKYDAVAGALRRLQDLLRQRGTALVFLPIPDKEHTYQHLLPSHPPLVPDPWDRLRGELRAQGVRFVDIWPAFQVHIQSGSLLYWPDDTHWNGRGIAVAAERTAALLGEQRLLLDH